MRDSRSGRHRSRSRSRSPILRGPKTVTSGARCTVNMLDPSALEHKANVDQPRRHSDKFVDRRRSGDAPRGERTETRNFASRARESGGISGRLSGGNFSRGNFSNRRNFGNRTFNTDRRSTGSIRDRMSFGRVGDNDKEDERKNGSFRDEDKPVQRLVDPCAVPKSKAYFDHDDRGGNDSKWRGRSTYDPRIDFGSRHDRRRGTDWAGFGGRSGRDDRDRQRNRDNRDRQPYRGRTQADGVWTHDKYEELEDNEKHNEEESNHSDGEEGTEKHHEEESSHSDGEEELKK